MFYVSSSPHAKAGITTRGIMLDVIIALLPASVFGIYNNAKLFGMEYGFRALGLIVWVVSLCILSEFIYEKLTHRDITTGDMSAVVTGMILALNLPVTMPYWMAGVGAVFAIIVVKMLFGGLGQNFMNPALGARCFLVLSFASQMTAFYPEKYKVIDGVSSATPLTSLKSGGNADLLEMFIGNHAGTIGETCVIALLIGAAYLLVKRVIDITIPFVYIASFIVFTMMFNSNGLDCIYLLKQLCGGGLVFGAFFMATDYTTSPITTKGRIIYGICLGLMTALIRTFGNTAEGVSFAIIFCNLLVPLIERVTVPRAFGIVKEAKER